jgi:hypothetical protein
MQHIITSIVSVNYNLCGSNRLTVLFKDSRFAFYLKFDAAGFQISEAAGRSKKSLHRSCSLSMLAGRRGEEPSLSISFTA